MKEKTKKNVPVWVWIAIVILIAINPLLGGLLFIGACIENGNR